MVDRMPQQTKLQDSELPQFFTFSAFLYRHEMELIVDGVLIQPVQRRWPPPSRKSPLSLEPVPKVTCKMVEQQRSWLVDWVVEF